MRGTGIVGKALLLGATALLTVGAGTARAQDALIEEARVHFEAGQGLYDKGEFTKAADEFLAAYNAKPFPAFLYNAGSAFDSQKDYAKAVEHFERYLKEEPGAIDRKEVEERIATLKKELARPKQPVTPPPPPEGGDGGAPESPDGGMPPIPEPPPPPTPLGHTKGITVIETNPEGAQIHIDDAAGPVIGSTTWSGQLPAGKHTIHLELSGYKHEIKTIVPSKQVQFAYYYFRLAEDPEFGFLVVTSNLPDAVVYLDNQPGIWGRVSTERNLHKGPHHIAVVREGYLRQERDIEVKEGKLNTFNVPLDPAPVGYVKVRTLDENKDAKVKIDTKVVCEQIPCRVQADATSHKVEVTKRGKKPARITLKLDKLTEATLTIQFAEAPSRVAAAGYFIPAAVLLAAGIAAGVTDSILDGTASLFNKQCGPRGPGMPWVNGAPYGSATCDVPLHAGIQAFYIGAGGLAFVVLTAMGIFELVADRGPPTTTSLETKELAWLKQLRPVPTANGLAWHF